MAAAVLLAGTVLLAVLLAGESSHAMLASARLSCLPMIQHLLYVIVNILQQNYLYVHNKF